MLIAEPGMEASSDCFCALMRSISKFIRFLESLQKGSFQPGSPPSIQRFQQNGPCAEQKSHSSSKIEICNFHLPFRFEYSLYSFKWRVEIIEKSCKRFYYLRGQGMVENNFSQTFE